ncbi:MAG TPA: hypothetical protein PK101_14380, partial [Thauera sp.]|nr:hypothetical protein [Thauera sp.]
PVPATPKSPAKPAAKAKPRKAPAPVASAAPDASKPAPARKRAAPPVKNAAAVDAPAPAEPPKATKATKAKKHAPAKPKLVRDSFTLPENDYALFASLKQRALKSGAEVKKSELLRAGLAMLALADDAAFLEAVGRIERIKTGRPKK